MTDFASLTVLSYERPDFLRDTLQSLQEAPGHPYELIIHDDGSTSPDTRFEVEDECEHVGATIIMNPPGHNQGQGTALNRMWSIAKGDPIIKLDADLKFYRGWLMEVVRLMDENPQIGLLGLLHYYHEPVNSRKTVRVRHDDWSEHTHILGSAFAMRRECYEELGPFSEHSEAFAEDWEMQNRVHESDNWVVGLPKESLVENLGMGYETSTVNKTVNGQMPPIKKEPFIIGKEIE